MASCILEVGAYRAELSAADGRLEWLVSRKAGNETGEQRPRRDGTKWQFWVGLGKCPFDLSPGTHVFPESNEVVRVWYFGSLFVVFSRACRYIGRMDMTSGEFIPAQQG